jgi:hypothetical protein
MIDITERMKMQTASRKPAKPKVKTAKAADKKKRAVADKTTANEPATASDSSTVETMEVIMLGNWSRDEQPVAWLPSAINNCRTGKGRIICFSDDQVRKTGANTIKFKTKAIISHFSDAGAFNVTYRNLVVNAIADEPATGDGVSAFDEAGEDKGFAVKTGWGKEHILECLFSDGHAIKCTKNNIHTMVVTSQQQVADRK